MFQVHNVDVYHKWHIRNKNLQWLLSKVVAYFFLGSFVKFQDHCYSENCWAATFKVSKFKKVLKQNTLGNMNSTVWFLKWTESNGYLSFPKTFLRLTWKGLLSKFLLKYWITCNREQTEKNTLNKVDHVMKNVRRNVKRYRTNFGFRKNMPIEINVLFVKCILMLLYVPYNAT